MVDGMEYYRDLYDIESLELLYHYIKEVVNCNYKGSGNKIVVSSEDRSLADKHHNIRNRDAFVRTIPSELSEHQEMFSDYDFERNLIEELDLEKRYIDGGYNWDNVLTQDEFQSYNQAYKKNKLGKP